MNYEGIDYPLTRKDESSIIEWRIQRKTSDFLQCGGLNIRCRETTIEERCTEMFKRQILGDRLVRSFLPAEAYYHL